MTQLLVLKSKMKALYAKYEIAVTPLVKFMMALVTMLTINANIGFMGRLKSLPAVLVISLLCSVLPNSGIVFVMMLVLLLHLFSLSMEVAVAFAMLFLVMCLLYYIFLPGDSVIVMLTPVLFFLKLPLLIPVVLGLVGSALAAVPMSFGIVIYYLLQFVKKNAGTLADTSSLGVLQRYTQIFTSLKGNKALVMVLVAFVLTFILVRLIRRLSVDHSWEIAIGTGVLVNALLLLAGTFTFDLESMGFSMVSILLGSVLATAVSFALQFFLFSVDYTRTEYAQFEDDEYYYYVKAVPKVTITEPDVQIKKITTARKQRSAGRQAEREQ